MLTANEMNKKLAEWAGFTRDSLGNWKRPEADPNTYGIPDFTKSLDACIQWLVPKVDIWGIGNRLEDGLIDSWVSSQSAMGSARAESSALALCLAILELEEAKC